MDSLSPFQLFGIVGVASYRWAYAALQFGWWRGDGIAYTLSNPAAALLVMVSLSESFNLPSALIQAAWAVLSLVGLARIALRRRARVPARFAASGKRAIEQGA